MRRKDKEVPGAKDIEDIIRKATICRLALCEGDRPYIVPLCFGYEDGKLYFHSASRGRKLKILENNRNVCFEMDIGMFRDGYRSGACFRGGTVQMGIQIQECCGIWQGLIYQGT